MKSKHLAKADYLRELAKFAKELYELGDFTSEDPERAKLSAKIEGYAAAGTTIAVVTSAEVQSVIDKAHEASFGESRSERGARIGNLEEHVELRDWEVFDAPTFERQNSR